MFLCFQGSLPSGKFFLTSALYDAIDGRISFNCHFLSAVILKGDIYVFWSHVDLLVLLTKHLVLFPRNIQVYFFHCGLVNVMYVYQAKFLLMFYPPIYQTEMPLFTFLFWISNIYKSVEVI